MTSNSPEPSEEVATNRFDKQKEIERRVQREMNRCKHFTGIQHAKCKVGVIYVDLMGGKHDGWAANVPCFNDERSTVECAKREFPTEQEARAEVEEDDRHIQEFGINILDESSSTSAQWAFGREPQPEEFWWSLLIGQDGMEKLNVYSFYMLGATIMHSYREFAAIDRHMVDRVRALHTMKAWFEIFLERSAESNWKATRDRAKQVLALLEPRVASDRPAEILLAPFDAGYERNVLKIIKAFEMTFASESHDSNIFAVSQKGTHSTLDLMERAVDNLPSDVKGRLTAETIADLCQAGRCLALDCHTASAYHVLRAVERVIIKYLEKVSGTPLSPKNRNWGVYIRELNRLGGDKGVTGYLDHIRTHYRNPIMHPEQTLSASEAFALFNASLSAISQLDAAIEAWP